MCTCFNILMILNIPVHVIPKNVESFSSYTRYNHAEIASLKSIVSSPVIPDVPFYSQFKDITSSSWQKVGCGVTSLAMVIDYYKPDAVSVNTLLKQGITSGSYQKQLLDLDSISHRYFHLNHTY